MILRSVLALAMAGLLASPAAAVEEPASGKLDIEATIPLDLGGGRWMTFGFDSLWTLSGKDLVRIDAKSNQATKIPLPGFDGDHTRQPDIGEGAVWVASVGSGTISMPMIAITTTASTMSEYLLMKPLPAAAMSMGG